MARVELGHAYSQYVLTANHTSRQPKPVGRIKKCVSHPPPINIL